MTGLKPFESMTNEELLRFIAQNMRHTYYGLVITEALTFDDVLLTPKYTDVIPTEEISTETEFVRGLKIKVPFLSAAMDTVTEAKMAKAMAKNGAVGVLHRNCTIAEQVAMVRDVKRQRSTMVTDPVTFLPTTTIKQAIKAFEGVDFDTVPIVKGNRLLGLVSKSRVRDYADEPKKLVKNMMIPFKDLHVAYEHTDVGAAKKIMKQTGKKRLPIIKSKTNRTLLGIYFKKDLETMDKFPNMSLDVNGRFMVGAAIGVAREGYKRAVALLEAGVDFLVIDTAQGHSRAVASTIRKIKSTHPHAKIIAGNVVTKEAAQFLIDAGADAVKVGVGPGAICTTREKTGNGKPQFSSILDVAQATKPAGIPLIADGGIKATGDIPKALAAGADAIMMGSVFAATDETPGLVETIEDIRYKIYRGMGSAEAMKKGKARDRYGKLKGGKKVAEGVSGLIVCKGPVQDFILEYAQALRQSMGTYQGARTIKQLQIDPIFTRITNAGQIENSVRGLIMK